MTDLKEQCKHVRIVEQQDIAAGGCRVQWGSGAVDATLDTQLTRIETALKTQSIDSTKEDAQ